MTHPRPVALVTGAGSGVGRATAIALSAAGFDLALNGRRPAPLAETAGMCGGETCVIPADASTAAGSEQIIGGVDRQFGRLDVLVNNAGSAPLLPLGEADAAAIEAVFRTNALGPTLLVNAAWRLFGAGSAAGRGPSRVINISSMATLDPFPGLGVYGAAKGAVNVLAIAIRNEGSSLGVLGFSVALGAVETAMLRAIVPAEALPTERTLSPEAVADRIVAIATGADDDRNGEVIRMPSP
jgi:NAD(P)-dependent dehydrogenase (short-subunit alcohol dehydrogenase family)